MQILKIKFRIIGALFNISLDRNVGKKACIYTYNIVTMIHESGTSIESVRSIPNLNNL